MNARKCQLEWSVADRLQSLHRSVIETTQMHAGIRHAFMQSAEAYAQICIFACVLTKFSATDI